ncbi:hypothetical protein P8452_50933 [Trifolium repens]|nr:hypothetical protein P8452_50933 [Trifolium repens]
MPFDICGFTHLRSLNLFIVGSKTGFGVAELRKLRLGGKLHIKGLENVSNETDTSEANLIGKKELSDLYLSWRIHGNSSVSVTVAEQVLEAVEPYTGLKYFGMDGYMGINIPNWMRNTSILEGLVEVKLSECRNFARLPPLGKLPCLTTLHVSRMRELKYIDDDLYEGATKKAFPSLKKMELHDLPKLEKVLKAEGVEMPQLSDLNIYGTPKLNAFPSLPSVETFEANRDTERDSIDGGAPFLRGIAASMHNLKKLVINYVNELKVLPNELNSLSSLQELHIYTCDKLESIPECVLQGLSSLQDLKFTCCRSLKSLPEGTNLTSLQTLRIIDCPKLSSLPASFKELINLKELYIYGTPKLNAFPSLPSVETFEARRDTERDSIDGGASFLQGIAASMHNLKTLSIVGFDELKVLPNELNSLSSLKQLHIRSCDRLESIPECVFQGLGSLQLLDFAWCSSLKSLPEGTNLTSLQTLNIYDCPKLSSLPASFKELINLHELHIHRCPVLEKRCKNETGEDWHKIDHVPKLRVESYRGMSEEHGYGFHS